VKVELQDVGFAYARRRVVDAVSCELAEGGITVVIGPSGSGKSTLLQLVAGLLRPAAGRVLFAGRDVAALPPERRDVGVVFQSYALFPHLSAGDNIAFGLTAGRRRLPRREVAPRVGELADLLGLTVLLDRRPGELSGGEQQRVALARAVAPRPALLLLDEPLSALDAVLRRQLRGELATLLRRLGTTVLYVTHDQEEALLLADLLVVLDRGRVVQAGPPLELYRRPADPFVASFLGDANLLPLPLLQPLAPPAPLAPPPLLPPLVQTPAGVPGLDPCPGWAGLFVPPAEPPPGASEGWLLIRPEDLAADARGAPALVLEARGLGAFDRVVLRLADGTELRAHLPSGTAPPAGATLNVAARRTHFLARPADPRPPAP
jgi:ABC-type Fe3+/spermidine/putrescine transport system ATPase subunit